MSEFKLTDGERCLLMRRRLGMTQAEAAALVGVCHVTLRRIEADERDASALLGRLTLRFETRRKR